MLASLDIKLIGVIGVILLIVVGYFVYSLYKDLVFLKSQINPPNEETGELFFKGEEPDDELEDEELELHLENIMRQTQIMAHEEHHSHIQEEQEQEIQVKQEVEEPLPKKRKYKKKVEVVVPEENIIPGEED